MSAPNELEKRARQYVQSKDLVVNFEEYLGFGEDGWVWETSRNSAIKVFGGIKQFKVELGCYKRLKEKSVSSIDGMQVPRLVDFDEELLARIIHGFVGWVA
jgi:hypothetical protein